MGQLDIIEVNGMKWPASDVSCRAAVFKTVTDMIPALDLVRGSDVAVQAGGNCGVWPAWLAGRFDTVYTFEPDELNFECLRQNVPNNVQSFCAALGHKPGDIRLAIDPKNVGAHYVEGHGDTPQITLDSLQLPACDYLCLDIEGYELLALRGAEKLIGKYRPVIQIEDKGLSDKYGIAKGDAEKWLAQFGYEVKHRVHRDVILA